MIFSAGGGEQAKQKRWLENHRFDLCYDGAGAVLLFAFWYLRRPSGNIMGCIIFFKAHRRGFTPWYGWPDGTIPN